jgi:hypothetical protein
MLNLEHLNRRQLHSHGGGVHHKERHDGNSYVPVHMSHEEVQALEDIDGGPRHDKAGIREFKLDVLKNPHIQEKFLHHHHMHVAMGGHVGVPHHVQANRMNGRFGDTEMVKIPKHVAHLFDRAIGGPCRNPIDGKHEYFLGALAGLAGNLFRAAAPAIGGALRGAASTAARVLPSMARTAGSALASGARTAGSALARGAGSAASGLAGAGRAAASGLGRAASAAAPYARQAAGAVGSGLKAVAKPVIETAASVGLPLYMHKKQMDSQEAMQREQMQQQQAVQGLDTMHDFGGQRGEYSSAEDIPVAPGYQGAQPPRAPQMTGLTGMGKRVVPYQEEQFYDARPYEGQ